MLFIDACEPAGLLAARGRSAVRAGWDDESKRLHFAACLSVRDRRHPNAARLAVLAEAGEAGALPVRLRPHGQPEREMPGVRGGGADVKLCRLRTFILITGTLLSLLIAVAFVVSIDRWVSIDLPINWQVGIWAGAVDCSYPAGGRAEVVAWPRHDMGFKYALVGKIYSFGASLPLVYPFVVVVMATILVWRFVPKPVRPGHCPCGYDLTGNLSGRSPECGHET